MHRFVTISCCVLLSFAATLALAQADFSADIVDVRQPGPVASTLANIYFGADKRRIEMKAASGGKAIIEKIPKPNGNSGMELDLGGAGDTIIIDLAGKTSTLLMARGKSYYEAPLQKMAPSEVYGLYASIRPADVENACVEWMRRSNTEGESCQKIGHETIGGRDTAKYDLSCYSEVCHLWIDTLLHALVKRESKWTSTELRNIQRAQQPNSLFEIPAGYTLTPMVGGIIGRHEPQ